MAADGDERAKIYATYFPRPSAWLCCLQGKLSGWHLGECECSWLASVAHRQYRASLRRSDPGGSAELLTLIPSPRELRPCQPRGLPGNWLEPSFLVPTCPTPMRAFA